MEGKIANSDLELAAPVLRKATLLVAVPTVRMTVPRSGSNNTPTFPWSMQEASTVNPVLAGLLRIHALHSRKFFFNPSIFYHPGQENCMADDASSLVHFYDTSFLAHMSVAYSQPHSP